MNRQIKQSLEPSLIPKRTQKQQILCDAIEQNYQTLERIIQVYVASAIKKLGNGSSLNCNRHSIQTIATDILQNTVETVLNKSEEFDLSYLPLPWIKRFAVNKVRGWQRDRERYQKKIVSIGKYSLSQDFSSEEEILGTLFGIYSSSNTKDSTMLEYLLSLANESDRQVLKLAFIDDLRGKDLAAALGVSEGSANTKKSRAIARLRKAYTQANPDFQEGK
ncbi:MAG: sigma-70 family RNA polymerase sigma factor [Xenococcaceae cyanobacterium MO_188.B29]|nr:sigma-70 family RNA polymerase sigma factor [Xenococcaceae cyanobacterium MO_188.B29]